MWRRLVVPIAAIALFGALTSSANAAPLCRKARPTADRFAHHLIHAWSLDARDEAQFTRTMRYHGCHRWQRSPERLWFWYSAHNPWLGRVSWWVRATWHGDHWHYYNQGLGVTLTSEMLDAR